MNIKSSLIACVSLAALLPINAIAQTITDEDLGALIKRINQLEQEVRSLRSELDSVGSTGGSSRLA